jgi:predicted aspartyl protease
MRILREKVKIAKPLDGSNFLEIEMVVDSGATYTQVPASLLLQMKIDKKYKRRLKIATGEIIERDAGEIRISIKNETLTTMVIFGDERSEPVTLEQFGLAIDPVNKILVPVPELMLLLIKPKHSN